MMRRYVVALILACFGCETHKPEPPKSNTSEPSPNASILPAPLATDVERADRDAAVGASDAGLEAGTPEPTYVREDNALPSDSIAKEESPGLTLTARFRWPDVEQAPRLPESNLEALHKAREQADFDVSVDLWKGRMRFALNSRTFTLPVGSELRTREDLFGYALVWPLGRAYSALPVGTIRSLFAEQRADRSQLTVPKITPLAAGHLLGFATERTEIATATGKLELEQGRVAGILAGTSPLCRLLLELVSADPGSRVCRPELVPLRAEFVWQAGGRLIFEVQKAIRRSEYEAAQLLVPPHDATFRQSELPPLPLGIAFSQEVLGELRTRAATVTERLDSTAPKSGLVVVNYSTTLRYVLVDGIPVARVRPGTEEALSGLKAGKYVLSARDFFGTEVLASKTVDVPGRLSFGEELK